MDTLILANAMLFLSTLSLRRATIQKCQIIPIIQISIHALLAESDGSHYCSSGPFKRFLSTLSLRRATHYDNYNLHCVEISIHALLAESDCSRLSWLLSSVSFLSTLSLRRATIFNDIFRNLLNDFYPRSPCGERLHFDNYNLHCVEISIHALLAESDTPARISSRLEEISIHALLAESDRC